MAAGTEIAPSVEEIRRLPSSEQKWSSPQDEYRYRLAGESLPKQGVATRYDPSRIPVHRNYELR